MSTSAALARRAHYFSTHCLHEAHGMCVGRCALCESPCQCACHGADEQDASMGETLVGAGTITTTEATT